MNLGFVYSKPDSPITDLKKAEKLFQHASLSDNLSAKAMFGIFKLMQSDDPVEVQKGTNLIKEAVNSGNVRAIQIFGSAIVQNFPGSDTSRRAFRYFKKAAFFGNPTGLNELGV